ncbi:MAG: hypothetical protein ACI8QQ_000923 [Psychroserpens sp.]
MVVVDFFDEDKCTVIGDVITPIDGKSVDALVNEMNPFYPASNQPTRLRDISFDLLPSIKNALALTIKAKRIR